MKIINNADLTYTQIGRYIDTVLRYTEDDTQYDGKIYEYRFNEKIKVTIKCNMKCPVWTFSNLHRDKEDGELSIPDAK